MLRHNMPKLSTLRQAITEAYRREESQCIEEFLKKPLFSPAALAQIQETAQKLITTARIEYQKQSPIEKLLRQYDLSSEEGISLMCLAEALLRIPDQHTRDLLISDKISTIQWLTHKENSLLMNAASWSLQLAGKIFSPTREQEKSFLATLKRTISSPGIIALRPIINQAMKLLGSHFVVGQTIEEALAQAKHLQAHGYRFSFDMLGEAARTAADATRYFESYQQAIIAIGESSSQHDPFTSPGISIKLSALHPRYEEAQHSRVIRELLPTLIELISLAKQYNIGVTIDAEEAERLELSLDIFELLFSSPELAGWEGLGLVVQAYQKRAPYVIDWLAALANTQQRRIMLRLVKGAYWDAEIKQSQVLGLEGYPVFTRKNTTDLSYLFCAAKLLGQLDCFYPQFGTHNAYSVAAILEMAATLPANHNTTPLSQPVFEFQCLHGMGRPLYDQIVDNSQQRIPTRIYAPVGHHQDLVGYLVRRLLENGANTSFIKSMADLELPVTELTIDPVAYTAKLTIKPHPRIPLPADIFSDRSNSLGIDLTHRATVNKLELDLEKAFKQFWLATPLIKGKAIKNSPAKTVLSPRDLADRVGEVYSATESDIVLALQVASEAQKTWANTPYSERAACLERAADLFQQQMPVFIALLCREGGKAIPDCIAEVRETIDFCRYYAARARETLRPQLLPGPTGETNELSLHPRGLIICISPWNFPLAIFSGQILAALVCGNVVIAKPAEQTSLIAHAAVQLLHQAGIPTEALQLLPGKGAVIGAQLIAAELTAGVMFTGSTETAALINQALAARPGPIIPFIAETGGQNAMIVDSSALPEQVVADVLQSAFNSAGQRCSALRILFVQEDIAPRLLTMLKGAMAELTIGDPKLLATDIGPVIDANALDALQAHSQALRQSAQLVHQVEISATPQGYYFAPCAFLLNDLSVLQKEVFGPILHILTYQADELDKVLAMIAQTGYGLTLGIHSRIDSTIAYIKKSVAVGNIYINRNMIGAVVGVQPFGGEHLSGTGPKAGGPYYLPRLCVERTVSTNTTAVGGNTTLVTLHEDENATN